MIEARAYAGVILPPLGVRRVVDKLADFVAQNQQREAEIERRLLRERSGSLGGGAGGGEKVGETERQRFDFILAEHPYNDYYRRRLRLLREGKAVPAAGTLRLALPEAVAASRLHQTAIAERRKRETEKVSVNALLALTFSGERGAGDGCTGERGTGERGAVEDANVELFDYVAKFAQKKPRPPSGSNTNRGIDLYRLEPGIDRWGAQEGDGKQVDEEPSVKVMKMVARYSAVYGAAFAHALQARERSSDRFDFLKASHPQHATLLSIRSAYQTAYRWHRLTLDERSKDEGLGKGTGIGTGEKIVENEVEGSYDAAMLKDLRRRQRDLPHLFATVTVKALEEERVIETRAAKKRKEAEYRRRMDATDWQQCSIVETIFFTSQDLVEGVLPAPWKGLPDLAARWTAPSPSLAVGDLVESVDDGKNVENIDSDDDGSDGIDPPDQLPTTDTASQTKTKTKTAKSSESAAGVKVRMDYVRPAFSKRRLGTLNQTLMCPITGKEVPANEMSEHLRVLLLDPQWRKERDLLLKRAQQDPSYAPDLETHTNITNLLKKRPDIFAKTTTQPIKKSRL